MDMVCCICRSPIETNQEHIILDEKTARKSEDVGKPVHDVCFEDDVFRPEVHIAAIIDGKVYEVAVGYWVIKRYYDGNDPPVISEMLRKGFAVKQKDSMLYEDLRETELINVPEGWRIAVKAMDAEFLGCKTGEDRDYRITRNVMKVFSDPAKYGVRSMIVLHFCHGYAIGAPFNVLLPEGENFDFERPWKRYVREGEQRKITDFGGEP